MPGSTARPIPDFWAITSYFNPAGYRRRYTNFQRFRAELGLPLIVAELAQDGRFEVEPDEKTRVIRLGDGDVMFQKEALLNVALDHLPAEARYVAWLDCDIHLARPDWVEAARAVLERVPIAQVFSELYDLPPCGTREPLPPLTGRGLVALKAAGIDLDPRDQSEHGRLTMRGLAWAARTALMRRHRFYDAMVIGGGDRAIEGAAYGRFAETAEKLALTPARLTHYAAWAERFHADVRGEVGLVDGPLLHFWHGATENRSYRLRHRRFAELGFDPARDLARADSGLWRWAGPRPELARFMADYFAARREDG